MPNASIGGLASGLDTATIISQLMQLEAVPQTRLRTRVSTEESAVKALQTLNTRLASLATQAEDFGKAGTWDSLKATSSVPGLTVTASAAAGPTDLSVTVLAAARAHQYTFGSAAGLEDQVTGSSTTVQLTRPDGTTTELVTDGTLKGLVSGLNDPESQTGVRATAVRDQFGTYQLLVEVQESGASAGRGFALTASDGAPILGGSTLHEGQDAKISLGAVTAYSPTNTFTDLMPGVTVRIDDPAMVGKTSQVTVSRDPASLTSTVKSFVDKVNAALTEIGSLTANAPGGAAGKVPADRTLRAVAGALTDTLYPADGGSMAQFGISVDRYGKLTFDEKAFGQAYATDPTAVATAFTSAGGFADRVEEVTRAASDARDGSVSLAIKSRNEGIARLQGSIEAWDARLEMRRTTLTRQFTALETALSAMNSQSSWLSGQISSLNGTEG